MVVSHRSSSLAKRTTTTTTTTFMVLVVTVAALCWSRRVSAFSLLDRTTRSCCCRRRQHSTLRPTLMIRQHDAEHAHTHRQPHPTTCLPLGRTGVRTTSRRGYHHRPSSTTTATLSLRAVSSSSSSTTNTTADRYCTSYDDGTRPFQITTPIYYVNDKPHIGHAYTSTACDVLARFWRLQGRDVFFVTGTDEHGQKVEQSAARAGVDPQTFVDATSRNFYDLHTLLNIQFDHFIRTTEAHHQRAVQHLWQVLTDKGHIYLGTYEGWYSVRDECFYVESELVDGKAPTGADVEWVAKEKSYFFRLSQFQDQLLEFYEQHPGFIAPEGRRNEVLSFVKGGLRDLSISRTSFRWGVPVPGDDAHVMYVWVDALTNYLSALGYPDDVDGRVAQYWPAALHVVGKDILRFHAVYWPALLLAADLPLPRRVFAHGWWTKDGQKISKSLGNVIDPVDLVHKYGVDQTRFFLMSEVNFGNDGDFSDKSMILKVNSNLANELGNLCQRTLSMVYKNCDRAIPTYVGPYTAADDTLLASARELHKMCTAAVATQAIQKYVEALVHMITDANKYIDEQAPWVLRKTDPERMATVLYVILEVLRHAAILYQPLIPDSANKILDQLAVPADERTFAHLDDAFAIRPGASVLQPVGIFPRIELPADSPLVESSS